MALQSQAGRPGYSRQHMVSRRKSRKGPWIAVFVLAIAVVGGYMYFYGGSTPTTGNTPGASPEGGDSQPIAAATPREREANPTRRPGTTADRQTQRRNPRETIPGTRTTDIPDLGDDDTVLTTEQRDQYEQGMQLIEDGRVVAGRAMLSELLFRAPGSLPRHDAQAIRERLTHLNQTLVFSKTFVENDPIAFRHTVQSGEILSRDIAPAFGTPYQFIMRINGISDATRINAGATLKCIRGPIHARIVKHEYRMDLYVIDPDGLRIYLCSYPVGLGEFDSTPAGQWRIRPRSKVVNPGWSNPRTGESFDRDDPNIPIGEYWMGLEGLDDNTRDAESYGIHGTNEETSIGQQESMGCVRMRDNDVEEVFYMLSSGDSYVEILP
ncbi:MAG: L,D-transpeptidase family protein [Phycisphaerales bacterium JB063]